MGARHVRRQAPQQGQRRRSGRGIWPAETSSACCAARRQPCVASPARRRLRSACSTAAGQPRHAPRLLVGLQSSPGHIPSRQLGRHWGCSWPRLAAELSSRAHCRRQGPPSLCCNRAATKLCSSLVAAAASQRPWSQAGTAAAAAVGSRQRSAAALAAHPACDVRAGQPCAAHSPLWPQVLGRHRLGPRQLVPGKQAAYAGSLCPLGMCLTAGCAQIPSLLCQRAYPCFEQAPRP